MYRSFRQFSSSRLSSQLALEPKKWLGLEPEEILRLSKTRRFLLGGKFRHDEDELKALISTSKHTGVSVNNIKTLYYKGEQGYHEINNLKFEDDHTPKPFQFDEYPEAAQEIIREHRNQREYNRIAAYEMPHLAKYRQEYIPPSKSEKPVVYKYTNYIGEEDYEANRKVSMIVKVSDLNLGEKEAHKFKILCGTRYDYTKDELKMSTDRFPESLQNTRYLSDVLNSLIKESKDLSKDDFSDVPLDTRHVQARLQKSKYRKLNKLNIPFPKSWRNKQDYVEPKKGVLDYVKELELKRTEESLKL